MPSPSTIRDLVGNASLVSTARCAMSALDAVQTEPDKGAQFLGLAAAFLLAAEVSGLSVPDFMGYARNAINHAEGRRPEFEAVATYVAYEMLT